MSDLNSNPMCIGSSTSRMSAKMMPASAFSCSAASTVTSHASSGDLHSSMKLTFSRMARYSGW